MHALTNTSIVSLGWQSYVRSADGVVSLWAVQCRRIWIIDYVSVPYRDGYDDSAKFVAGICCMGALFKTFGLNMLVVLGFSMLWHITSLYALRRRRHQYRFGCARNR